jgi:hypothetical protein
LVFVRDSGEHSSTAVAQMEFVKKYTSLMQEHKRFGHADASEPAQVLWVTVVKRQFL